MPAFAPILGAQPRILILGSMPGQRSLDVKQYYAHPRNVFWPIMMQLFDVDTELPYQERVSLLMQKGVCVWDVLHDCERPGSLDSRIVRNTEQVNDFHRFFKLHPSLRVVGFNGQAARKIFHRHCKGLYDEWPLMRWVDLPSTSPAHAAVSAADKATIWSQRLMPTGL